MARKPRRADRVAVAADVDTGCVRISIREAGSADPGVGGESSDALIVKVSAGTVARHILTVQPAESALSFRMAKPAL